MLEAITSTPSTHVFGVFLVMFALCFGIILALVIEEGLSKGVFSLLLNTLKITLVMVATFTCLYYMFRIGIYLI